MCKEEPGPGKQEILSFDCSRLPAKPGRARPPTSVLPARCAAQALLSKTNMNSASGAQMVIS
ncbi:hypothetical protein L541_2884 [Bordetella hinzii CA90 BAL1384]|uniref:Uncharacterized protein n=1 Tax=Bordetella hinzii OH87 BAL007II TaxID=1331262 RepID=A0ABR4QXW0_9BORD|nr:hypothetical protein L544_2639 [Bordetella hinzii OH87 BAL007II]KCB28581.1 hypothetical protein L543_3480 [Bordetella hinzii L60]KCB32422.1 hypothetical protein L541_2884 [Bordetella hinzii CA90 BAL1384]KCB40497.1 hypothetical protein L539_3109 [Bordetella hinzii 5132]KCB49008.1 hypothetical protein L538_2775 [Bordetella hinzii 4161]KCB52572.1 hypothetical protein L537_2960 [Bordetella hinzii 1277]